MLVFSLGVEVDSHNAVIINNKLHTGQVRKEISKEEDNKLQVPFSKVGGAMWVMMINCACHHYAALCEAEK